MNAIGLQNIGVCAFVSDKLPPPPQSMLGADGHRQCLRLYRRRLCRRHLKLFNDAEGVAMYELNASWPKYQARRHGFRHRARMPFATWSRVVRAASERSGRPLMVKLSPNVTSIAGMAKSS